MGAKREQPWRSWDGRSAEHLPIEVKLRDGEVLQTHVGEVEWEASEKEPDRDIVAYRWPA